MRGFGSRAAVRRPVGTAATGFRMGVRGGGSARYPLPGGASSRVYSAEVRPPANLVEPRAQHVNKRAKVTPFARRQKGSQATFCNQKREVGL